jgi:hypothetical protein
MILDARAENCFSWTYVLKKNDRAIGKFEGQWFSENQTVNLTERRHLELRKTSWWGSEFELVDVDYNEVVAWCAHEGIFSSSWDMNLSIGPGKLVHCGWFETGYEFLQDGDSLARVDRLGFCERGWTVDAAKILRDEDVIMIGLIYHIIIGRQRQQQNAAAAGS